MKGERRHELEQNQLAEWLGKSFETVRPYQNAILGVLLLAVVGGGAYVWWSRQSRDKAAEGWEGFYAALSSGDPAKFDTIIEQFPNTHVAHNAGVMAGDIYLIYGCNQLFVNKASANQELRKAVECYLTVLEQSKTAALRERATFGLARAREAMGDLKKSSQRYKEVTSNWPDGTFSEAAARRLEDLKRPETLSMYDKFAKFDPRPAYTNEPGVPGQRVPFSLDSLPDDGPAFPPSTTFDMELEEKGPDDGKTSDSPQTPAGADESTEGQPPQTPTETDDAAEGDAPETPAETADPPEDGTEEADQSEESAQESE